MVTTMDWGLCVLTGADAPAAAAPPAPKPATPEDIWAPEPKPLTGIELRDHLFTAATYAMLFGVGLGALSDQEEAAMGLLKTSVVLGIPAGVLWVMDEK